MRKSSAPPGASRLPAFASNDPLPMRLPCSQLSSMNLGIEDWSLILWLTKLSRVQGEMTTIGRRGPKPQRSLRGPTLIATDEHSGLSIGLPLESRVASWEPLTIGDFWWSYQPSESS